MDQKEHCLKDDCYVDRRLMKSAWALSGVLVKVSGNC